MRMTKQYAVAWTVALLGVHGALAAPDTNLIRWVSSVSVEKDGAYYDDHQSVSVSPDAHGALLDLSAYPWSRRVGLNAFAVISNRLLFVPDTDFVQDSVTYTRRDVVAYDPVAETFSKYFNGAAAGIPAQAGIDALAVFPGNPDEFLFSLDVPATLPPPVGAVRQHDVLYRNLSNGVWVMFSSGALSFGFPPTANLNALYISATTETLWYFSLDKPWQTGRERDVWRRSISNLTPVVELALINPVPVSGVDLVGLDFPLDRDGDGLTDFEEYSGYDEPSTVWPGTTTPIDPDGNITDPLLYDTDGDGFSDAEEAIARTDPNDLDDYLRLLGIHVYSDPDNVDVVIWRSEAGRQYSIYSVSDATSGLRDQDWQWIASMPGQPGQTGFTNIVVGIDEHHYQIRLDIAP